jgi:hypothetical protein
MEINQDAYKNQQEFREILKKYGITQTQAADLIKKETNQDVSERKIRSWLAKPESPSARGCPNWAITALKKATINHPIEEQTDSQKKEEKGTK